MYAGQRKDFISNFYPHEGLVEMCGYEPDQIIQVELTENPEGEYKGWIEPDGQLCMITHKEIFEVQFPYGSAIEEEKGYGKGIRLSLEVISD